MSGRDNNFDALRLGAAISVVLTHAILLGEDRLGPDPLMRITGGQCTLGVAGVFVFFTISGYLVTQSFEATGRLGAFLAKRALRIYPGLAACVLLLSFAVGPLVSSLTLSAYFADPGSYRYIVGNLYFNTGINGLPGVNFTRLGNGWVVNGPLWSLPCEVLMYLMVAGLGSAGLLRGPVLAVLFATGLVATVVDTSSSNMLLGSALWLLPFFAAGMLLYRFRALPLLRLRYAAAALAALALAARFGGFVPVFAACGSYLVIYLAYAGRPLRAARFGDLSYGLYIYGWPVEQLTVRALGGAAPGWEVFALALPATAAVAFLSWHLVEAPALRLKPRARGNDAAMDRLARARAARPDA
ncbi:MAG TPA: acyltransferase [Stellaceae bacterium]|nr:acyltransferase [Stellaceae bacterium]